MSEEPENNEHRTFINLAVTAFVLVLAIIAFFVVKMLMDSEKLQKCLNMGRHNCITIDAPPRSTP